MRVVLALIVAAGCGFSPTPGAQAGDDTPPIQDAPAGPDARLILDGPASHYLDAPPCADDDGDGVCNDADDWPCGAKPAAPANQLELEDNSNKTDFKLTTITLAGTGTLAVAAPNAAVRIQIHVVAKDDACPQACVDQLEVGWHPTGHRAGCLMDQSVDDDGVTVNIDSTSIHAPATPGSYELRVHIGQNFSCNANGANDWWGGTEPSDVIAKLCVH